MKFEIDIRRIEKLAAQKADENWKFRNYLKGWCDLSSKEIDTRFKYYYEIVSKEIDCTKCANCCIKLQPLLSLRDVKSMATHLGLSYSLFLEKYIVEDEEEDGFVFNTFPCPLLKDNLCTVYSSRPLECRAYPHLDKKDRIFSMTTVFESCSVCLIVYNVYELLKKELWHG